MSDLQATFEFSVELYKFYNVDLFQRGLYQVRVGLRVSPKVPVHIEASVSSGNGAARTGRPAANASLVGGLAASRAFQIMYRNEEVTLRDIVHFRAHLLVDSRNLKESLERAEWSLGVELWCGEGAQSSNLAPVSCRVLKLHFQPAQGLHYHLPVLFDYFHLSAVSITIHTSLVALHQPYINTPRSSKQWGKLMKNAGTNFSSSGSLENILFGSSAKCTGGNSSKIAHARQVHAEVCGILLGSLEGLQNALAICGSTGAQLTPEESSTNSIVGEVAQRIKDLSDTGKKSEAGEEEEWAMGAAHDIARLCAEVTLRWRAFLHHTSDRPHVHHALAARHHALRIKRFAECFFVLDNPRHSLAGCYDSNYQSYQSVGEAARRSRYLALLPPLPVHCIALDGDPHIMPIIFEDRYQDTAEFARRRSFLNSNANKSGSDPFLCTETLSEDCGCSVSSLMDSRRPSSEASRVTLTLPKAIIDVLEPQFKSPKSTAGMVQATLTLAPQKSASGSPKRTLVKQNVVEMNVGKATKKQLELTGRNRYIVQNNQISEIQLPPNNAFASCSIQQGQQLSRYSASTLLDINATKDNHMSRQGKDSSDTNEVFHQKHEVISGVSTLPARHSKSLDQLRIAQMTPMNNSKQMLSKNVRNNSNTSVNYPPNTFIPPQQVKPTTLPRSVTTTAYPTSTTTRCAPKGDDYRRNISEFREKYKNPFNPNVNQNSEVFHNVGHKVYGYTFGNQGNPQVNNVIRNPLEFQRGYSVNLPRPMLPPRNSYPPVSGKNQVTDQASVVLHKHVHRSNSTHVFHPNMENPQIDIEAARNQLRHELNYYLQKGDWSYDFNTGSLIQNYQKKSSKSSDDSGFVMTLDRSSDGTSKSTYSKTPPSTPHSTMPSVRHKKSRSKESKLNHATKENSKINSSRDSLTSHHSIRSRDSKSDRCTPKSDRSTPKSDRGISRSGKATPKSGAITPRSGLVTPKSGRVTPKSGLATPKSGRSSGKPEKRSKHKPSEKMSQLMSEAASSSSSDSIPFELRRLESSASVPYSLDQGPELLRHCRSAASVLEEPNINNTFGSESLPNLAPPPAFESPPLDIADKDFKILPPENFSNKEEKRSRKISPKSPQDALKSKPVVKKVLKDRIDYTEKLIAAEIRSLTVDRHCKSHKPSGPAAAVQKYHNKARSEIDLAHFAAENEYEHLPPPQQFRDAPPPPDEFKDPPSKSPKLSRQSSKASTPSKTPRKQSVQPSTLELDNPLYHVCEGIRERRKLRPHQSVNSNSGLMSGTLNKSQSTGELATRNENEQRESNLVSIFGLAESERLFVKCREEFRQSVKYPGAIYSDFPPVENSLPYFHISDEYRMFNPEELGLHLIICVHGLDGNAADLRLVKTYLELGLPGARLDFLMSERNQGDTFSDFDTMTDRLVQEILAHIQNSNDPARISFVGHSLGTIIIRSALARPQMKPFLGKLHTFLSLSGPHLGTLYNSSGLVNAGMWFMQKWKKSGSLLQLSLRDASDPRRSFLYRLSERSQLHQFKHILLCGSGQDRYVPLHSARLELCKAAAKDTSLHGQAYREMVHNMVSPLAARASSVSVVRYDVQHALPHTASALVGRAAHIAALDSDLFIEKFLLVSAMKAHPPARGYSSGLQRDVHTTLQAAGRQCDRLLFQRALCDTHAAHALQHRPPPASSDTRAHNRATRLASKALYKPRPEPGVAGFASLSGLATLGSAGNPLLPGLYSNNAAPTETEKEVYEEVQRVLLESEVILEEIQCYKGAGKEIREAIADPSRISQERAWRAVKPLVDKLLRCYNHSLELQRLRQSIPNSSEYLRCELDVVMLKKESSLPKCCVNLPCLKTSKVSGNIVYVMKVYMALRHDLILELSSLCFRGASVGGALVLRKLPTDYPGIDLHANSLNLYNFTSIRPMEVVPRLLGSLVGGAMSPTQHLEQQQALVKQFAEILEFVLKFDEYKMKTPAIQNDFSYYRRSVSRGGLINPDIPADEAHIGAEVANRMSLFYAQATPMLKVLSEATSQFVNDNQQDLENTTETLSTMAKVCLRMLENPKLVAQFSREETSLLVLRVMVGLIILYDWVHPSGAFCRSSSVDVKGCVKFLQQQTPAKAEPLLNALRYTTKHLNNPTTPKNIRTLLAA
ncbi:hypothetical protein MSG28_005041 [Choristoneura fumiferana]|uniref:Uncharacterized protein n=1 Tax=Choristoneura fumiferana TaxID=7141 RepID=A0ACC0JPM3_CHOFU|nr:hypothetical protein MSG28_005041 [Choristoneura fumiferana]